MQNLTNKTSICGGLSFGTKLHTDCSTVHQTLTALTLLKLSLILVFNCEDNQTNSSKKHSHNALLGQWRLSELYRYGVVEYMYHTHVKLHIKYVTYKVTFTD